MLADRDSAGAELAGETYLVHSRGVAGFLTQKLAFGRLCVDRDGAVEAQWLLDDVHLRAGQIVELDPLWVAGGQPGPLYSTYAQLSGEAMNARLEAPVPTVWCSWYQYFGDVSAAQIRENAAIAVPRGIDVIQIDDGWQKEIGVWNEVSDTWGEPMSDLARDIRALGATAGIWSAPFLAIEGGLIATERRDWLVKNESGEPSTALFHGGWGGKIFALDTSRDDVIEHISSTYRTMREWGYDYFKIDFCHAGAAVGRRSSDEFTRAQCLRRGLGAVRDGIGDDAYLLGCGCPLLSAVGIVDAMRVSEDVAPFYEPRLYFDGFEECSVAARNSLEASLLRAPLHARWFTLDADCALLRPTETDLITNERRMVAEAIVATGGLLALSDRLALYGDDEWQLVGDLLARLDHGPREIHQLFEQDVEIFWNRSSSAFNWNERRFHTRGA
jgi:alpha-galactosidase